MTEQDVRAPQAERMTVFIAEMVFDEEHPGRSSRVREGVHTSKEAALHRFCEPGNAAFITASVTDGLDDDEVVRYVVRSEEERKEFMEDASDPPTAEEIQDAEEALKDPDSAFMFISEVILWSS